MVIPQGCQAALWQVPARASISVKVSADNGLYPSNPDRNSINKNDTEIQNKIY